MKNSALLFLGLAVAAGVVAVVTLPRGLRNNNPGNIRRTSDNWVGLAPQQTDPEYFQFADPVYGIRAMARVLANYSDRYGLDTVRKIVNRWAPPSENPTAEYVDALSQRLQIGPDTPFDVRGSLPALIKAIIYQENGQQPYPETLIERGIALA